ncbi:MAG: DUF434 domain-containing protein [Hadesarchaea archaeon]|nr:DUF434 domain-containing protein [Hadesarchaea archaeon]
MMPSKLVAAVRDLRYLLDRGYPRTSAVRFVANHYGLGLDERHLLARCVFSKGEIEIHRAKAVGMEEVRGKRLGIDGYNVLITIEGLLSGRKVIRCDDGFLRDLSAIFGKYRTSGTTRAALVELLRTVRKAGPGEVALIFDKQVSRSGELSAMAREEMGRLGLAGDARTAADVDRRVRGFDVVASSDRAIIERSRAVWDIPAAVARGRSAAIVDLRKV